MSPDEKTFLLEEFRVNWDHLNLIEERRYHIFQYYSAFIGVAVTATFTVLKDISATPSFLLALAAMSLLICTFSAACHSVLAHEREANLRYRDRINAIRSLFLSGSEDLGVLHLTAHQPVAGYIETAATRKDTRHAIFALRRLSTAAVFSNFIGFWALLSAAAFGYCGATLLASATGGS